MRIYSVLLLPSVLAAVLVWPRLPSVSPAIISEHDIPLASASRRSITEGEMFASSPAGPPLLSDIIGLKQCTIMSDYTLSLKAVALRLADPSRQTLVLAPLNSAIMALPRKPWVDGPESSQNPRISPLRNEAGAAKNIEAFVERHVIDELPSQDRACVKSEAGQEIQIETRDGVKYINGKHKVVSEKKAANGAIWVISGVIEASIPLQQHEGL